MTSNAEPLTQILSALKDLQQKNALLNQKVCLAFIHGTNLQLEAHQLSTQTALLNLKTKLDTIPSGLDPPFQRNPSSTSIRSMSPSDALSSSPPFGYSPPKHSNGNTGYTSIGNFSKVLPASPSVSVSAFALPADKKDEATTTGGRERGSFEQTRGNWGNRIVLTTYPGQANVGMTLPLLIPESHVLMS